MKITHLSLRMIILNDVDCYFTSLISCALSIEKIKAYWPFFSSIINFLTLQQISFSQHLRTKKTKALFLLKTWKFFFFFIEKRFQKTKNIVAIFFLVYISIGKWSLDLNYFFIQQNQLEGEFLIFFQLQTNSILKCVTLPWNYNSGKKKIHINHELYTKRHSGQMEMLPNCWLDAGLDSKKIKNFYNISEKFISKTKKIMSIKNIKDFFQKIDQTPEIKMIPMNLQYTY